MENVKFSGQFREKTTVSVKEFTNLNDLISASSEADATIPPIHVEVASRNALNSLTKDLLLKYGKQVVKGHSFSCKLDKMGLALPLKDSEIKGIEEDEYPLIFTFNSLDDMAIFATAFEDAIPVKRVSSKFSKAKQNSIREMFSRKEKNILTIIACVFAAFFAAFLIIPPVNKGDSNIKSESNYDSSVSGEWVGTWRLDNSFVFVLRGNKTATVTTGDDEDSFTYNTRWEEGGDYAVIGATNGDTWLLRNDGDLFIRGKDGNMVGIVRLQKQR